MKRDDELRQLLVDMATKAGSVGICTGDITTHKVRHVDSAIRELVAAGRLFKGKIGHRTVRIFSEEAWARAYEQTRRTVQTRAPRVSQSQEAVYPKDEHGNPLYKITYVPSNFDPFNAQVRNLGRWNADPLVSGR